jgi:hypothetical protein
LCYLFPNTDFSFDLESLVGPAHSAATAELLPAQPVEVMPLAVLAQNNSSKTPTGCVLVTICVTD